MAKTLGYSRQPVTPDPVYHFKTILKTNFQEKLNLARKCDSKVIIRIPIQEQTFRTIQRLGKIDKQLSTLTITKYEIGNVETLLDRGWWFRIANKNGDFAYVKRATARFWMYERRALETFSKQLTPTYVPRGCMFVFTFVKGSGNRSDMDTVL